MQLSYSLKFSMTIWWKCKHEKRKFSSLKIIHWQTLCMGEYKTKRTRFCTMVTARQLQTQTSIQSDSHHLPTHPIWPFQNQRWTLSHKITSRNTWTCGRSVQMWSNGRTKAALDSSPQAVSQALTSRIMWPKTWQVTAGKKKRLSGTQDGWVRPRWSVKASTASHPSP